MDCSKLPTISPTNGAKMIGRLIKENPFDPLKHQVLQPNKSRLLVTTYSALLLAMFVKERFVPARYFRWPIVGFLLQHPYPTLLLYPLHLEGLQI